MIVNNGKFEFDKLRNSKQMNELKRIKELMLMLESNIFENIETAYDVNRLVGTIEPNKNTPQLSQDDRQGTIKDKMAGKGSGIYNIMGKSNINADKKSEITNRIFGNNNVNDTESGGLFGTDKTIITNMNFIIRQVVKVNKSTPDGYRQRNYFSDISDNVHPINNQDIIDELDTDMTKSTKENREVTVKYKDKDGVNIEFISIKFKEVKTAESTRSKLFLGKMRDNNDQDGIILNKLISDIDVNGDNLIITIR